MTNTYRGNAGPPTSYYVILTALLMVCSLAPAARAQTSAEILIYNDKAADRASQAATLLGLSAATTSSESTFQSLYASQVWPLVIIDSSASGIDELFDSISSQLDSGRHVIISFWNYDGEPTLTTALGITCSQSLSNPETVYPAPSGGGLFSAPHEVPPLSPSGDAFTDNGDACVATTSDPVHGYFESSSGAPALASSRGGLALVNGFLWDEYAEDDDSDGTLDVVELIANQIVHVTTDACTAPAGVAPSLTQATLTHAASSEACAMSFEWSHPGGFGATYQLYLDDELVAEIPSNGATSHSAVIGLPVAAAGEHAWTVTATDCDGGMTSSSGTFNTGDLLGNPPVITAPQHNSTVYCDPTITWDTAVADGVTFSVVTTDGVTLASDLTEPSWTPSGDELLSDGKVTYRIVASSCFGDEVQSGARSFIVDNSPAAPVLASPSAGQVVGKTPTFTWSVTTEQKPDVTYSVRIDGVEVAAGLPVTTQSWTAPAPLADGAHTWEIVADGCRGGLAASGERALTVDAAPPDTFDLTSPADGTWYDGDTASIPVAWSASADAPAGLQAYELYVDGELALTVDATTTQSTIGGSVATTYSTSFETAEARWALNGEWTRYQSSYALTGDWLLNSDDGGISGNYADNRDDTATWSPEPDMALLAGATLEYSIRMLGIENNYDYLETEVRPVGGTWTSVRYDSSEHGWGTVTVPLDAWEGQTVEIRFRFHSDGSVNADGFIIDDFSVGPLGGAGAFAEGEHSWQVKAVDAVGNATASSQTWTFGIDLTGPGPVSLISPADNAVRTEVQPTFSWAPATDGLSGVHRYELWVDGEKVAEDVPAGTLEASPAAALSDGLHTWSVVAVDGAGNVGQTSATRTILIDTTSPPTVELVRVEPKGAGDWVSSDLPMFVFRADDGQAGSGISHFDLYIDGVIDLGSPHSIGVGDCPPDTCATSFDLLAEGVHTWHVVAFDNAGHTASSEEGAFVVELLPPEPFEMTTPAVGATVGTFSPTLCWESTSDLGSGLSGYRIDISSSASPNLSIPIASEGTGDTICHQLAEPLVNGSYTWIVTAIDLAGNERAAAGGARPMTVEKDVTPPVTSVTAPAEDGALTGCVSLQFTGVASDPGPTPTAPRGSGPVKVEVQVDGTDGDWTEVPLSGEPSDSFRGWTWSWEMPGTGSRTLHVRATDQEGNVQAEPTTRQVYVDCTGPADFALLSPPEGAAVAACPTLSWEETTDSPAGMGRYELQITRIGDGEARVIDTGAATAVTLTGEDCLGEGTYTWSVTAYDAQENPTGSLNARTLHVDLSGPLPFPILGQTSLPAHGWICNGRSVNVSWSPAADSGPDGGAGMADKPYQLLLDGSPYGSRTSSTSGTLANLSDGTHTWSVMAYDVLGNETQATVVAPLGTFAIDCTAPAIADTVSMQIGANHVPSFPSKHSGSPRQTGLVIQPGETLRVTATGTLCFVDDASCSPSLAPGSCMGPEGKHSPGPNFSQFYPDLNFGRLVGSVVGGEASPFDIGAATTIVVPTSGQLQLAVNDNDTYNCKSRWLDVTVQRLAGFNLVAPTDGALSDEPFPTLSWSPAEDAHSGIKRIELVVNDAVAEGNLPADATAMTVPAGFELTEGVNTWSVRAYDRVGNVAETATWTIQTDISPPNPFQITHPAEGDVVNSKTPSLCWEAATDDIAGMAHYLIYLPLGEYNTAQYPDQTCQQPSAPLAEGPHCFAVKAQDALLHERTSSSARCFVVDTQPPAPFQLVSPPDGEVSYTATPKLCWQPTTDGGSGLQAYEIWLSGNKVGTVPAPDEPAPNEICWEPAGALDNGTFGWFVKAIDGADLVTQTAPRTITIQRDVTPPTVSIEAPAPGELFGLAGVPLTIQAVDPEPGTGVAFVEVFNPALPAVVEVAQLDSSGGLWTHTWPVAENGEITVCARGWDHEGNANPATGETAYPCVTVTRDVSAPAPFAVISPADDAWVSARPTLTWQPSIDEPAGIARYLVTVDDLPAFDAATETFYELDEDEALSDGSHSWTVTAVDTLGNAREASNVETFRVDGLAPNPVSLTSPATGSWSSSGLVSLCWAETEDQGESGICGFHVRVDGEDHLLAGTETCHVTDPLVEGTHAWDVAAVDCAGNVGPVSNTRTFTVDLTAPPAPLATYPDDGGLVKTNPPALHWQPVTDGPTGNASGICSYVITLGGVAATALGTESSLTWKTALSDGSHGWQVHAVDCAGNVGDASPVRQLLLDATPPPAVALLEPISGAWLQSLTPTLRWTGVSDASQICSYVITLDGQEIELGPDAEAYVPASQLPEGSHTFSVTARDCAGNLSVTAPERPFGIDATDPDAPTPLAPADGACVSNLTPAFQWSAASDDVSGVADLQLLIDGSTAAGALAADAVEHTPDGALDPGLHQWALSVTDLAGNTTTAPSATFRIDPTPPSCTITSIEESPSGDWDVTAQAGDGDGCGVSLVEIALDDTPWAAAVANDSGGWTLNLAAPADGTYAVSCRATDGAGNLSAATAYEVTVSQCTAPGPCDPETGECTTSFGAAVLCDDGELCTAGDRCNGAGECTGDLVVCEDDTGTCGADRACNGSAECTVTWPGSATACDDGSACTAADVCDGAGACSGVTIECTDGDLCTDDGCDPAAGCVYTANALPCDDGDACTLGDTCASGNCVSGSPAVCADDNPCTSHGCDPASGCLTTPNADPCDDGDACTTGDTCAGGACVSGSAVSCDDGEPCTDDGCDSASGCVNLPATAACDDGDACTVGDLCVGGSCTSGGAAACGDGNSCTDDGCESASGCVNVANLAPCEDGDACTTGDTCASGTCVSGPALSCDDENPCTDDTCEPASGCAHTPSTAPCDDGDLCTTSDACESGVCVGGPPASCDDANPCTDDSCGPATGCAHTNATGPCDDGDACTGPDECDEGSCAGAAAICDDENPCTADSCEVANGCVHVDLSGPCDDGDACTIGESCEDDGCVAASTVDCDDGNPCTDDTCDAAEGCVFDPNQAPCDDGQACTGSDACQSGACAGGPALTCDDGDACTDDSCDAEVGCVHTTDPHACDDGSSCTSDSCEPSLGCLNVPVDSCCDHDEDCPAGSSCQEGACMPISCRTCQSDAECGTGYHCAKLPSGSYCLAECGAGCLDDTVCGAESGLCEPAAGDCECQSGYLMRCQDDAWVELDSCGNLEEILEECSFGCAPGDGCCPPGASASESGCTPMGGDAESAIDAGPTTDVGAPADAGPTADTRAPSPDGGADVLTGGDAAPTAPAPAGTGGCQSGSAPSTPGWLAMVLLALLATLRRRRTRLNE